MINVGGVARAARKPAPQWLGVGGSFQGELNDSPWYDERPQEEIAASVIPYYYKLPQPTPTPAQAQAAALAGAGPNQKAAWEAEKAKEAAQLAAWKAGGSQRPEYNSQVPGVNGHYTYDPRSSAASPSAPSGFQPSSYYQDALNTQLAGYDKAARLAQKNYESTIKMLGSKYDNAQTPAEKAMIKSQMLVIQKEFKMVSNNIKSATDFAVASAAEGSARGAAEAQRSMGQLEGIYAPAVEGGTDAVANVMAASAGSERNAAQADLNSQALSWANVGEALQANAIAAGARGATEAELSAAQNRAATNAQHYAQVAERQAADRANTQQGRIAAMQLLNQQLSDYATGKATATSNYQATEGQRYDQWAADQVKVQKDALPGEASKAISKSIIADVAAYKFDKSDSYDGIDPNSGQPKSISFNPRLAATNYMGMIRTAGTYSDAAALAYKIATEAPDYSTLNGKYGFDVYAELARAWPNG